MTDAKTSQPEFIVLGSRSPRRRELLEPIVGSASLRVMPPTSSDEAGFEDVHDDASIEQRLLSIVRHKHANVCQQVRISSGLLKVSPPPSPIVVVADTIVMASNDQEFKQVLGQPDAQLWKSQVREWFRFWLAGRTHEVWTGVIVSRHSKTCEFVVKSQVSFFDFSDELIEWYLSVSESLGKAGGYAIQGHAAAFVSQLSGSLTNVIGLPLMEVMSAMQSLGWNLPSDPGKKSD